LLKLDDALDRQAALAQAVSARGGHVVCARDLGPAMRLWSRPATLEALRARLRERLPSDGAAELVFAGSGDFHHVTPLLLERALAGAGEPVTVLHFDNHPDWARFAPGPHCGSWVRRAARLPGVARVISIGLTSDDIGRRKAHEGDLALIAEDKLDLFAWRAPDAGDAVTLCGRRWPTIAALGETAFLELLGRSIPTGAVYVTVDKDVLAPADAVTNWDQGCASLDFVEAAIARAVCGRRLVGADVVGDWSRPRYGAGPAALLKRGEAWLDQPRRAEPTAEGDRINEAANLRLLQAFAEAAE
jgi:arginase family enzyme